MGEAKMLAKKTQEESNKREIENTKILTENLQNQKRTFDANS